MTDPLTHLALVAMRQAHARATDAWMNGADGAYVLHALACSGALLTLAEAVIEVLEPTEKENDKP